MLAVVSEMLAVSSNWQLVPVAGNSEGSSVLQAVETVCIVIGIVVSSFLIVMCCKWICFSPQKRSISCFYEVPVHLGRMVLVNVHTASQQTEIFSWSLG